MALKKKDARIDKTIRKSLKKKSAPRGIVVPKNVEVKKHPTFPKEYGLIKGTAKFDGALKIDHERCVGKVFYVIDLKSRVVLWMATKMPDGAYPAWSTCQVCMHRFDFCTCKGRGVLEPKVMRWMHDRVTNWRNGMSAEDSRRLPPPDYSPWVDKNRDRETLDISRYVKPGKAKKKSLFGDSTPAKPVAVRKKSLKSGDRAMAVAEATADITSLDFEAMNRRASKNAKQAAEEAQGAVRARKPLRRKR